MYCAWDVYLILFFSPCQNWPLQWQSKTWGNLLQYRKPSRWERKINWQVSRLKWSWEGKTGSDTQPVSLRLKKGQHCFLCATRKKSLAGIDVNEERLHLFLPEIEAESTQPPLMKWGRETETAIVLPSAWWGGGCLTRLIPQKQESDGGLCTALTPNRVKDNPVIKARDSGNPGGEMGKESYS